MAIRRNNIPVLRNGNRDLERWAEDVRRVVKTLSEEAETDVDILRKLNIQNLGTGGNVFKEKESVLSLFRLRSILAGSNITVTENDDDLTIAYSGAEAASPVYNIIKIGSNTTLDSSHFVVRCDATSGAFTVSLPSSIVNQGRMYHIKKIDSTANAITVDPAASQTIDDDTTKIIRTQYDCLSIIANGSNWDII